MPNRKQPNYALEDCALYNVRTRKRLAEVLLSTPKQLEALSELDEKYVQRWKPKKNNSGRWLVHPPSTESASDYRLIEKPDDNLKIIQSRIAELLARVIAPDFLFSPVRGRSYVDNAARHLGARAFHLLDIADFFPSCRDSRVTWFFRTRMRCEPDVAAILRKLTTYNGCLPQGAPSSPILAYFSNEKMWLEISREVATERCVLSIYADDITISGQTVPGKLVWKAKQILYKNGFRINKEKELSIINAPADITGVIVRNNKLYLPNRQRLKIIELFKDRRAVQDVKAREKIDSELASRFGQMRQVEGR